MKERQTQETLAFAHESDHVHRHHFVLHEDFGGTFSAVAITKEGALRVLDAEIPGAGMSARYDGVTHVPCHREQARANARLMLNATRTLR